MAIRIAYSSSADVWFDNLRLFDPDSPDAQLDPTGLPVDVAFVPVAEAPREPLDAEWVAVTVHVKPPPAAGMPAPLPRARLAGTARPVLDRGRYTLWMQSTGLETRPRGVIGDAEVY